MSRLLWWLAGVLPAPLVHGAARLVADLAVHAAPGRRLRRNLARVVPAAVLDPTVRAGLRSYARYWADLGRPEHLLGRVRVEGVEHLDAAVAAGRGVLLAAPHSGNWDAAGAWVAGRVGRITTVVERLRPESRYRRFVALREALGFEVLPLTGSGSPVPVLLRRLRAGGVVCLLADRDLTATGVPVTFFGETAHLPPGPAWLAARTGAALLPVASWHTPEGSVLRCHPPLPVTDLVRTTQALADVLAEEVAGHPADWHMLAPLWTADAR
ncbi:KDO2-lipid IV(A) lauroyltransferase [Crossiella equi]|uniref:KDO2-lipid IV(A) lauroyltransferase n=1 Tax=Crossiella equi TaxID=130796 RepID=A0ABS5ANH8_9PSEU|nr:phosphatidylinositol mannoside acyltransferase [Crossiella equi]MBP2478140.1 KDO2-lipid IV(A) lauroyltransferase [Crossiella equi]